MGTSLERVRAHCLALPGASERPSHSAQAGLVAGSPEDYFRPPYVGHRGWIGVRLDRDLAWDAVAGAIEEAWLCVAPAALVRQVSEPGT